MALRLDAEPEAGQPHVVQGWVERRDGRKTHCGTSLRDAGGRLLAVAQQTWIEVDVAKVGRATG
jgi:acyl-CoA thioesterase FadM